MARSSTGVMVALAVLLSSAPGRTADPLPPATNGWKQLRTDHFLVVGSAREAELKDAALRLERFHGAWERLFGPVRLQVPNVVTVMKDADALTPYKPRDRNGRIQHRFVGLFNLDADAARFTLAAMDDPVDTYIVLYKGYASTLARQVLGPLPEWVEVGLSEFFSAFDTEAKGRGIIGRIPEWRKTTLRRGLMLPLERIVTPEGAARTLGDQSESEIFYAESWGLIHYLMLNPARLQQFSSYLDAVTRGVPATEAFTTAFATTFDDMEAKLKEYLRATMLPLAYLDPTASVDAIKGMKAESLPRDEALAIMGGLSMRVEDTPAATIALKTALEINKDNLTALTGSTKLLLRSGEFDDAVALSSRAVTLAPESFSAQYWLGEALLAAGRSREATDALSKAVRLNGASGPALFASSLAALDLGRRAQADATLTLAKRFTFDQEWTLARARHAYTRGIFDLAATDADAYVRDVGHGSELAHDGLMLAALARLHLKQADAARRTLQELASGPADEWQSTLARFLVGDIDVRALLREAKHDGQTTEAHTYMGLKASAEGRVNEALDHLKWVRDKGRRDYFHEYRLALGELRRLETPPPSSSPAPQTATLGSLARPRA